MAVLITFPIFVMSTKNNLYMANVQSVRGVISLCSLTGNVASVEVFSGSVFRVGVLCFRSLASALAEAVSIALRSCASPSLRVSVSWGSRSSSFSGWAYAGQLMRWRTKRAVPVTSYRQLFV